MSPITDFFNDVLFKFDFDMLDDGPPTVQQVFRNYQNRISELKKQTLEGLMVMQKVKKICRG